MNKRKILERALGDLISTLAEESRRFLQNKREPRQVNSELFRDLMIVPKRPIGARDD